MGVLAFDAEAIVSGILDTARLGSGAADNTKYLRGDQSWQVIDLSPYVPYTGATTNLNMGAFGVTASTLTLSAVEAIVLTGVSPTISNGSGAAADGVRLTSGGINVFRNSSDFAGIDLPNYSGIKLIDGCLLTWSSTASISGTADAGVLRSGTGLIDSRADNGFRSRNYANSADAPVTCAALTASGAVTVPNNLASGSIIFSGTTSRIRSSGSSAYFEGQVSLSMGGTSISDVLTLSTANNTTPFARIVGYTNNSKSQLGLYTKSGQTVAPFLLGDSSLTTLVGLSATADVLEINNGTTGTVRDVSARTGTFTGGTVIPGSFTVATLPSTSAAGRVTGARATVTDSNATITAGIGAVVAGGGTDVVCVMWDGTDWRIA